MSRKTIIIIIIILVVLCGLGAVIAAGGAGLYFSTRGNNTAVETPHSTKMSAQSLLSTDKTITSEIDGMTLLYVPAGKFQMGSTEAQYQAAVTACNVTAKAKGFCEGVYAAQKPLHTVYLDAFRIDQTDVTNKMYANCVSAGACKSPFKSKSNARDNYYGDNQYGDYPVIYVDWNQADAYCQWTGRSLPTAAQWEKAARGTDGRIYPWGNQAPDSNLSNYYEAKKGDTTQVGSYPAGASPYGALDMGGNVLNWVADWSDDTYYANSPERNPKGPLSGDEFHARVVRGGSFEVGGADIRSYKVWSSNLNDQSYRTGFRCALSLSPSTTSAQPLSPALQATGLPSHQPAKQETPAADPTQPPQSAPEQGGIGVSREEMIQFFNADNAFDFSEPFTISGITAVGGKHKTLCLQDTCATVVLLDPPDDLGALTVTVPTDPKDSTQTQTALALIKDTAVHFAGEDANYPPQLVNDLLNAQANQVNYDHHTTLNGYVFHEKYDAQSYIATFTVTNAPSSATTDTPALLPTDEANLPPVQEADATGAADSETISSTQTETPAYFQVYLKNDCDKTAQFAIHYKNLDDAWVTDGWWELRPGEFSYVADTTNKILYYYGERLEGGNPWWGTDLSLNVNGSTQFYGFKEYTTTNTDWGKWIISFTCPSGT